MQPTPLSLAQFFSSLTGRQVSVSIAAYSSNSKGPQMYGLYSVLPDGDPLIVRASLTTLAQFGGSMLGLPDDVAMERALETPADESLRDAMHEVLNITATAISSEKRVVFKAMAREPRALSAEAERTLGQASSRVSYRVSVDGEHPELLAILH